MNQIFRGKTFSVREATFRAENENSHAMSKKPWHR